MKNNPPKIPLRFFRWYCHPQMLHYIEGDLQEVYAKRLKKSGKRVADLRFVIDVILLFRPGIVRPMEGYKNLNNYGMIKSYFTIGWRNIARQRLYTVINVSGLALGICACIVIYTITSYEFSFDTFHPDKEKIYRVMGDLTEPTGHQLHFSKLPVPLLQSAKTQTSGLAAIAGVIPYDVKIKTKEANTTNEFESREAGTRFVTTVIADQAYFEIFKYEWLAGNAADALAEPASVVITEKRANQYFGSIDLDKIIGKQIIYDDSLHLNVSGVVRDWSGNTDLAYTDFISFNALQTNFLKRRINSESWEQRDLACWIYAKLDNSTTPNSINTQLEKITKAHTDKINLSPWLESLSDVHFNADVIENPIRTAHLPTLRGLIAIAIFILLLAMINFVNLSTAQSIQRAKEVGVRKVLGSSRTSLSFQFLTETLLLTVAASLLAILLIDPVLNKFKSFIPAGVTFHLLEFSTLTFLFLVILITTLFSGFYPALVVSSYLPALSLRGVGAKPANEKWILRKGLIVFQFSVSLVFIIGSIVITQQLNYTREKELGFSADAIVLVETPRSSIDEVARLNDRVKRIPGVSNVALQWVSPMELNGRGRNIKFKSTDEKAVSVVQVAGNEEFIPVYQIKLLAGRNLVHADSMKEFVINENLTKLMGCKKPQEALGKMLYWDDKPYPVVGVVGDFHTRSFHEAISPMCIVNRPDREGTLAIKLSSKGKQTDSIKATLAKIENTWKEVFPDATFSYTFYEDSLARIYESDRQTATLINTSMAIAVFISCIGLFGLTLFTSEKRSKEISIRKILGASVANITIMLSKDFVLLVILALLIASPIAFYFMNQWLLGFAYHIDINWLVFAIAAASALLITLITISYQSIKAAIANPVKNLRSE